MSSSPEPAGNRSRRGTPPAVVLLAALLAAVLAVGCTGGPPAPDATTSGRTPGGPSPAEPGATPTAHPVASTSAAPPTTVAAPGAGVAEPPSARLMPPGGSAFPGDLGGYTWAGAGSDGPWLVPPPGRAVSVTGPYAVAFDPPLPVETWVARWAPVVGDGAGDAAGFEEGGAGPILVAGPAVPGTWTMQVDARFAGGGRAAWYWRLELAP